MPLDVEVLDCGEQGEGSGGGGDGGLTAIAVERVARALRVREGGNQRGRVVILDNLDALCPYICDQETFMKDPQVSKLYEKCLM